MAKNRSHTFANLAAELLDRLPLQIGVPYKMTRTNQDYAAKLAAACGVANTAKSERAGSMLSSYLCGTNYMQRVPDPTGVNTNPNRSGHYALLPDGVAFKQSQGQVRAAMMREMIRRFRRHGEISEAASAKRRKVKAEAAKAAASQVQIQPHTLNGNGLAAASTILPEMIEIKATQGGYFSVRMKDSPENRKKVATLFLR